MKNILNLVLLILISSCALSQNKNIDRLVDKYAAENQLNGTVLIQKGKNIIYHKSFGVAERSFDSPVTNETKYQVCSITKNIYSCPDPSAS